MTTASPPPFPTNCLSVDVEGFIESNLQSFGWDPSRAGASTDHYEIEANTDCVLRILDELSVKGTFFFVGRLAKELSHLVRQVAEQGHEVACHSYEHVRIFGVTRDEFRRKLQRAKKELEDVSGQPVAGFRAPEFSITTSTLWALDVLLELGFAYDSSVYPIAFHDVYGIAGADVLIHKLSNGLMEFPLATIPILGIRFPFGGGGYFRLYPLWVTKLCLTLANRQGRTCMLYIHPYEVGPCIPRVDNLSFYRQFRHYYNCERGSERLRQLLRASTFEPAIEIIRRGESSEGTYV